MRLRNWSSLVTWSQEVVSKKPDSDAEPRERQESADPEQPLASASSASDADGSCENAQDTTQETEEHVDDSDFDASLADEADVPEAPVEVVSARHVVQNQEPALEPDQQNESNNESESESPKQGARRNWVIVISILLLASTGIAIGVIFVIAGEANSTPAPQEDTNTTPNDNDPADRQYLQDIRTILVPPNLWSESNAPQMRATEFMTFADSKHVDPTSTRLVQRYALLVLYFANGGDRWPLNPLLHECDWPFVVCSVDAVATKLYMGQKVDMTGSLPAEIGLLSDLGKYRE